MCWRPERMQFPQQLQSVALGASVKFLDLVPYRGGMAGFHSSWLPSGRFFALFVSRCLFSSYFMSKLMNSGC